MHPSVTQTDPAVARSAAAGSWTPAQRSAVTASFLAWVFDAFDFFLMVFLMCIRALFGIAMGGVWGVGASLTMETIPPSARGTVSGLLQAGYPTGYLTAALVYALL